MPPLECENKNKYMNKTKWEQGVYKPEDFMPKKRVRLSTRKTNKGKKYWTKRFDMRFKQTLLGLSIFCLVVGIIGAVSTYHTKKYNSIMAEYQGFQERYEKRVQHDKKVIEQIKNESISFFKTPVAKAEGLTVEKNFSQGTVEQTIRRIAKEENFQWPDYLVRLAKCESSLNPKAVNTQGNKPKQSRDRGLFQISDHWHKEVPDSVAYDIESSTRWTIERIKSGYQHEWVCDNKVRSR